MSKLLVEYRYLDKVKIIREGTGPNRRMKVRGVFQRADEVNNNGRVYPKMVLEGQVKALQGKISERSLVGALDHPPNDAIHLSQASHLITRLWMEKNEVFGEAEILSTPAGKIVDALLSDGVKIGISSRGLGTVSESTVNEDFRLLTFDLVSDPSTRGAYPSITEAKNNSDKAQKILEKFRAEKVFLTALSNRVDEVIGGRRAKYLADEEAKKVAALPPPPPIPPKPTPKPEPVKAKKSAKKPLKEAKHNSDDGHDAMKDKIAAGSGDGYALKLQKGSNMAQYKAAAKKRAIAKAAKAVEKPPTKKEQIMNRLGAILKERKVK